MDPHDFGLVRTVDFVRKYLPRTASVRILEVGAGRGRLTDRLRSLGWQVDAIDKSSEAVKLAAEAGVSVQQADISDFTASDPYDGILFCMSAHHVSPLDQALNQVKRLLKPGGVLIFEEYAVEDADEATARWYEQTRAFASSLKLFEPDRHDSPVNLTDPLRSWQQEHSGHDDHHFNTGAELLTQIGKRFEVLDVARGPYFFRYLAPRLAQRLSGLSLAENLFELEERLIAAKQIQPLGLRIVAKA